MPPPADAFAVVSNAYRCNAQGISDALTFDPVSGMPLQYVTGLQQCGTIASDPTCTRTSAAAAGLAERALCKTWDFIGDPFGGGGYLTCIEPAAPEEVYLCSSNVAGMTPESAVSKWFTQAWTDSACSIDPASCSLSSETCTAPGETRVIGGVAVTRPCWERTRTYLCQSVGGGGNDWFVFTATAADVGKLVHVVTGGNAPPHPCDTVVEVFAGSCASLVSLGGESDDFDYSEDWLSTAIPAAGSIWVKVSYSAFGFSSAPYTLLVSTQ